MSDWRKTTRAFVQGKPARQPIFAAWTQRQSSNFCASRSRFWLSNSARPPSGCLVQSPTDGYRFLGIEFAQGTAAGWIFSTKAFLTMLRPLLATAALVAQHHPATANDCYPTSEFAKRLAEGGAIFVGVAKDIVELAEYLPEGTAVKRRVFYFSVIKAEKKSNIQQAFLTVTEFAVGGCGVFLPCVGIGDTVLVYARSDKEEGVYGMCHTPFSILSKPIQFEHGTQVCFPGYLKEEVAFLRDSSKWYTPKGDLNPSPRLGTARKLKTTALNAEPEAHQTVPKKNATRTSWLYIMLIPSLLLNLLFLFHTLEKSKK